MFHSLDDWHAEQTAWRIAAVLRIEPTLEGCSDHLTGHETLTH